MCKKYLCKNMQEIYERTSSNKSKQKDGLLRNGNELFFKFIKLAFTSLFKCYPTKNIQVTYYAKIFRILICTTIQAQKLYYVPPTSNDYQITEAFYYNDNTSITLQDVRSMMNITSTSYLSLSPNDIEFDVSPVSYFTLKINGVKLVHQFIVKSGAYNEFNSISGIWLAFRLNNDRDFVVYTEFNQTKIFDGNYARSQWFSYDLLNPFMASEIQIFAFSENPSTYFTMDFRFIEPVQYLFENPIIGLYQFMASDFLSIKLDKSSFISGMEFDKIDFLLKFCIYYSANDQFAPYKDNSLFDITIFTVSPRITLRPFRTSEINLSCLNWLLNGEQNISITLLGDDYLSADFVWLSANFIQYNTSYYIYTSIRGSQKLFGSTHYLQNNLIKNLNNFYTSLMSNQFGADCITQPHLCVDGFTIQLDVAVPFSSSSFWQEFFVTDFLCNASNSEIYFGLAVEETFLVFNKFILPSTVNWMQLDFHMFHLKDTIYSNTSYSANIYAFSIVSNNMTALQCSDYYNNLSDKTFFFKNFIPITLNGLTDHQSFELTSIINTLRNNNYGVLNGLCLIVKTTYNPAQNVIKFSQNDFKLSCLYRDTVVGDVRSLNTQNVNESSLEIITLDKSYIYSVEVSFDQVYYMTGIKLWSQSPIDVDLLIQAIYFYPIGNNYFTVTKISLHGGESQYVPFNSVIKAKNFRILLTSKIIIKYNFYGTENTYSTSPILSAGLGGYQKATHGNGFQIHLTDNQITATVVTNYGKYKVSMTNPLSAPYTLTLVWSVVNDTLYLYYNDTLKSTGGNSEAKNFSNFMFNEYILVFADYYNSLSTIQASLSKIRIWRIPLTVNEISQVVYKAPLAEYSYSNIISQDFFYGSDCNCIYGECPCETLDMTATVEYASRLTTYFEVFGDDYLGDDQFIVSIVEMENNYTNIYFDNIVLNFNSVFLLGVYLNVNLLLSNTDDTISIEISNSTNSKFLELTKWVISKENNSIYITSPDLTKLLRLFSNTANPITVAFRINSLNIQQKFFLKIKYKIPQPGGFIHANAMQSSSEDMFAKVHFNVIGECVSFKFKFGGPGFSNLAIFGNKDYIKTRLAYYYRQEAQDKWINVDLDLSSQKFQTVEFVALKNGLKIGYIAFSSFKFFQNCLTGDTSLADNGNIFQMDENHSLLYPVVMVTDYGVYTNFKTNFSYEFTIINHFFNSYDFKWFNRQTTFNYWPISDFTILFWFKDIELHRIFIMTLGSIDFIRIYAITDNNKRSVVLYIIGSIVWSGNIISSNWHYIVIQYYKSSSCILFQLNFQTVKTCNVIFPSGHVNIFLRSSVICFQVYDKVLFSSMINAVQFCPLKQWNLACTPQNNTCEWCNPLYGRWENFTWHYIINNNMSECFQVPDAPSNISTYTWNRTTVRVSWNSIPLENSRGIITSYIICRRQLYANGTIGLCYCFEQLNTFMLEFGLTNLKAVSIHNISVAACNKAGCGNPNYIIAKLSPFAPESSPENFTAIFNLSSIYFTWSSLENTTDVWNDNEIPGFYQLRFISVTSSVNINISFTTINTTDNRFVLENVNSCLFYIASINAFSVGAGPKNYLCIQDYQSVPYCMIPFIESFYVSGSANASFITKNVLPNYFRGNNIYWRFNVNVTDKNYNPGLPSDEYLRKPIYLINYLDKYSGHSDQCSWDNMEKYFNQKIDFVLDLVGLHPYTQYEVSIQLCNELGCGNISNSVTIQTYSDVPSCEPTLLQMQNFSSTSMNISWNGLNSSCANIDLKQISYTLICNRSQGSLLINELINATTILLTSLNKYEQLCCEVAASNINGTGPRSSQSCAFTNEDISDAPSFIYTNYTGNSKTIRVSWSLVLPLNSHGVITSYEICKRQLYMNGSTESIHCFKQLNSSICEFYLTRLRALSTYNISVAACNTAGCGKQIFIMVTTMPSAPDSAPKNFTAFFNKTLIQFNWDCLQNTTDAWGDYKTPGFYQLSYGLVTSPVLENINFTTINISTCQFVLENVSSCYFYIASITAFSIAAGPESVTCIQDNLTEPLCMKPFISSFYVSGSSSASFITSSCLPTFFRGTKIYWFFHINVTEKNYNPGLPFNEYLCVPVYLNNSLEKYSVYSDQCALDDLVKYFNQKTDFVLDLVGLHPYTQYEVSIQPCNELGCGNISNSVTIQTYSDVPSCEPILLEMQNLSSTSMKISWSKLNLSCANIDLKQIIYTLICNQSKGSMLINKKINDTTILLSSLNKNQQLCCRVAASNVNGTGPYSPQSCAFTDEDLPDAPPNIFNSTDSYTTITVKWLPVSKENSHGTITSYEICRKQLYKNNTVGTNYCIKQINGLILEFNFTNLDVASTHNISVAACNKIGCGKQIFVFASSMQLMNANWSAWSIWSECSQSCNGGIRIRSRQCIKAIDRAPCIGSNLDNETCQLQRCSSFVLGQAGITDCNSICEAKQLLCSNSFPKFYNDTSIFLDASPPIICSNTSTLSAYSSSQDPSFNSINGTCLGYVNLPTYFPCKSDSDFIQQKMHRLCYCISKGDIGFSVWLEWSFCSETCGESSVMIRTRICNGNCSGASFQKKRCDVPVCPVNGEWSDWGPYASCNASCGYGVFIRTRACNNPPQFGGGTPCYGPQIDIRPECGAFPCPIDGGFSEWTEWSICDKPCGNGTSKRVRRCNNPVPAVNGKECSGKFTITRDCFMTPCIAVEVNLVQRTLEKWTWKMYSVMSYESQNFTIYFMNSVRALFDQQGLKGLTDIFVNKLVMGSVVVNYTLRFEYLYGQIVDYLDAINSTKKLMNILVTSTQYSSNDVPCPPPHNINVSVYNKFNVWISWSRDSCSNKEVWLYLYYKDVTNLSSVWEWKGVPSGNQSVILSDLAPFHVYNAYLLTASSNGNGLPSRLFVLQTSGASPERPPANVLTKALSSTEIYVEWIDTLEQYRNGKILGYKIRYRVYLSSDPLKEVDAQYGFNAFILKALKPFTLYYVDVYGYNLFGAGPSIYSMCKTLEDAPSVPVPNIQVNDMQSSDWWSILWDSIPAEKVNGILLGYRLTYYMSYRSGEEIFGERIKYTIVFDPFTRYHKQTNLLNYAIYNFSIAGFTSAGSSPAYEYQARTCKCKEVLFANSFIKDPFVFLDANKPSGDIVDLLQDMVVQSCGICNGYSSKLSKLYFDRTKFGGNPVKNSEFDLKLSISNDIDISFPIYGRNGYEVATNTSFMLLIQSPGIAAVQRDESNGDVIFLKMILNVLSVWSFLLITCLIASLFGILVWFTDQFINPEQFIIGNAWKGPIIGFWFSFVTMTTIGYGDLTPRSFIAKLISIIWFIIGLTLNSIIIGFIVTNITSITLPPDFIMYDTEVAALQNSFEYKTAIRRNAKLERNYSEINTMMVDLQANKVKMVYIDIYSLLDYYKLFEKMQLKLAFIDSTNTGYGIVLSGSTTALLSDFKSFVNDKCATIMKFAQALQPRLPVLVTENSQDNLSNLFTESSPQYKKSLIFVSILIGIIAFIGLCIDYIRCWRNNKTYNKPKCTDDINEVVSKFCTQFRVVTEQLTKKHQQEQLRLYDLKKRYFRIV
ncbi:uncharacterized protein LOC100199700 isoform X3 [Hydra vulgaris]|uniref:Uncharacterized protein LOC100199700 isoform X3 n=1 Tax=Hydra vulgaris TaxID=6087 RepID=A0ABM4D5T2_HYDVU